MTSATGAAIAPRRSLRTRLVRLMVVSITVASVATLATVAWINVRISRDHLAAVERQLAASIEAKGKVLTENQALALKGMVADNAFSEVDRLVRRVVAEEPDVVFGLFLSSDGKPWAYYGPDRPAIQRDTVIDPGALAMWKQLGIIVPPDDATAARSRTRPAFGQDVIEFAMPVRDDDDVLGSIHYGLSTRSMQQAREVARAQSRAALVETLAILVALAAGTALFFLVLAVRQAARITRPLGALTAAAAAIAAGRRDTVVQIASGDELELLGGAFNQMVRDLDASYSQLEDMNRNLEHRVEQRTTELASRNRDMRLVLDNVGQGFITVDRAGIMAVERSAVVDTWLGSYGPGSSFAALVGQHDATFARMFELGLDAIRDGWMPLEVILDQLPTQLAAGARELRLSYSPVFDSGTLTALLVVAADVTERVAHERSERAQRDAMAAFESAMRDRRGFLAFFGEADQLVGEITGGTLDADLATLKRVVHTLKGNAAIFGLSGIATLCHDIESGIEELAGPPRPELRDELARRWRELAGRVRSAIGDGTAIVVGDAEYHGVVDELAAAAAPRSLVRRVAGWRLERVDTALGRLGDKARALADRLHKPGLEVVVDAGDLVVDPRRWDRLWSELIHVIRNSVDHGIEPPADRESRGKSRAGTLVLRARAVEGSFVIAIGDDGAGIDWGAVAAKARARGLPAERREDLERAMRSPGFSTRNQVTATSGRGVGLDAVRMAVEALDGHLEIDSTFGHGTTVRCVFPEEAMAGAYYLELEARLRGLGYTTPIRRRGDSIAASIVTPRPD
jgi:HAMP domain-containing protein/HPt (histidine-containing phosphotransfer) domain-containing protein